MHFLITNLPPELFATFCTFLRPADLFTLSQVCRKFRRYLCAPNSFYTQQIWKETRLRFMPKEDMTPPEGMCEEKYVVLLMTERGCQFCKCKGCKIYWEFGVRCCYECFSKKTISIILFDEPSHYPQEFLNIMPYTFDDYGLLTCYYWKEQIEITYSQYNGLSNENLQSWLDGKKHKFDSIMNYAKQRKLKEEKIRYRKMFSLFPLFPPLSPPLSPLLSPRSHLLSSSIFSNLNITNNDIEDIPQLIQFHIQRLENYEQENIIHFNGLKRNNFIENKKKKKKTEFYRKHIEFHMKGRSIKNKFAHKCG